MMRCLRSSAVQIDMCLLTYLLTFVVSCVHCKASWSSCNGAVIRAPSQGRSQKGDMGACPPVTVGRFSSRPHLSLIIHYNYRWIPSSPGQVFQAECWFRWSRVHARQHTSGIRCWSGPGVIDRIHAHRTEVRTRHSPLHRYRSRVLPPPLFHTLSAVPDLSKCNVM